MTTITARVPTSPAVQNTARVATQGETAEIPASLGADSWGGTWGATWGFTWYEANEAIPAVPTSPAVDVTARVAGPPAGAITKRISL
jgi:hypothetical protein